RRRADRYARDARAAALGRRRRSRTCLRRYRAVGRRLPVSRLLARWRAGVRRHRGRRSWRSSGRSPRELSSIAARERLRPLASGRKHESRAQPEGKTAHEGSEAPLQAEEPALTMLRAHQHAPIHKSAIVAHAMGLVAAAPPTDTRSVV